MSGLFESLSSASTSLLAQRMGLDVTGQNIANINTPGYARRVLELADVPPTDPLSAGGGVSVVAIRAMRDQLVESRIRNAQSGTAHDAAVSEMLASIEGVIGLPGSSLDADLTNFFDAWSTLAEDPTSLAARDNVTRRAQSLTLAFGDMARQLTQVQQDADAAFRASVVDVNRLASDLASLNVDIAATSYEVESIRDRQAVILSRLSELADVSVLPRADGGVDVTLKSGRAIVIGEVAYPLDVPSTGFATVTLGDVDVTAELDGGRLGGLRRVRDTLVPGYLGALDQLAYDVAGAVNTIHTTGFDLNGSPAANFFITPATAAGAAGALVVDPAILADSRLVAASATGAVGDNGTTRQLANLRDAPVSLGGTRSVFVAWGQLAYGVGSDVSYYRAAEASHSQIVMQLQALRAQTSGVSYDEETAHLMRYQRAYEANARYFQTIVDTLDTLMEMMR